MKRSRRRWSQVLQSNLFTRLSLRKRLTLVFTVLTALAIGFAVTILFGQRQIMSENSDLILRQQAQLERSFQLRDILGDIERNGRHREFSGVLVSRFESGLRDLRGSTASVDEAGLLERAQERFRAYGELLSLDRAPDPIEARFRFEEAAAAVSSLIKFKEDTIYRVDQYSRDKSDRYAVLGLSFLMVFILALLLASMRIISAVTEPLSDLADSPRRRLRCRLSTGRFPKSRRSRAASSSFCSACGATRR
jgi:hypothetical protein